MDSSHGTRAYIATDSGWYLLSIYTSITVLMLMIYQKAERDGDKLIIRVHPSLSESGYLPARITMPKTLVM